MSSLPAGAFAGLTALTGLCVRGMRASVRACVRGGVRGCVRACEGRGVGRCGREGRRVGETATVGGAEEGVGWVMVGVDVGVPRRVFF